MRYALLINPGVLSRLSAGHTRKAWMAPRTLTELAAMFPGNWLVRIWDEFLQGPIPKELLMRFDLIGLTGLTPSRPRTIQLAKLIRETGVQLIVGGRDIIGWSGEVNGLAEMSQYYPSICTSVCDPSLMAEIAADAEKGQLKPRYHLANQKKAELVVARRDLIDPRRYFAGWTLRSSESCNRRCPWCTVGGSFHTADSRVLEADVEAVHGSFFLDFADSFAGDPVFVNEVVLPIYSRSGLGWGTEITVEDLLGLRTGKCLIEPMAQAGCKLVYIGVESVTRNLTKKSSRATTEEAIRRCRTAGIVVVGSLILDGSDERDETAKEITEMSEWATRWLDFAQFSLVSLLPGCQMRKEALSEGWLIDDDPEHLDGTWPTRLHNLSQKERLQLLEMCYKQFSRMPHVLRRTYHAPSGYKGLVLAGGLRYRHGIPTS